MESSQESTGHTQKTASQGGDQNRPDLRGDRKKEIRAARNCFGHIERLSQLMAGYPPGHPMVEEGLEEIGAGFDRFFEKTDRLTAQVFPHWLELHGTGEVIWETEEPNDYCFVINRDGIYLLHFLDGVTTDELQRFVSILNDLVDQRQLDRDAVSMLFDGGFDNIFWEAIDESLARLAGLEMKDKDSPEEQEKLDQMFEEVFDESPDDVMVDDDEVEEIDEEFEVRIQGRGAQRMKLEVGSRHFLELSDEAQQHLTELKRGFQEHSELEHRQGEVLSAVLGAKPRSKLRKAAVEQIGQVMGGLLETKEPWEALALLRLVHQWRDKFQPQVAGELKETVRDCFTGERLEMLAQQAATSGTDERRAILQMFNALKLDEAAARLVGVLGWDLEEDARRDIIRYVNKHAGQRGIGFIEKTLPSLAADQAGPLIKILKKAMPKSRDTFIELLERDDVDPAMKVEALGALRGSWQDATEIRDYVVPYVQQREHSGLRIEAVECLGEDAPQHVYRVLEPLFTPGLAGRPDDEIAALLKVFSHRGGTKALDRLEELVQRKKLAGEEEIDLAVTIVNALIKAPNQRVIELLESTAGAWTVAGPIRSTCKEVLEMMSR